MKLGLTFSALLLAILSSPPSIVDAYPVPSTLSSDVLHRRAPCALSRQIGTARATGCAITNSFEFKPRAVNGRTNVNTAGRVTAVNRKPSASDCDHVLEMQLVSNLFERNDGFCDQAPNAADLRRITDILNAPTNLNFVTSTVNKQKTKLFASFLNGESDPPLGGRTGGRAGKTALAMLAAVDYLDKTKAQSKKAAEDVDRELRRQDEDGVRGLEADWDNFLGYVERVEPQIRAAAQRQQQQQDQMNQNAAAENERRQAACGATGAAPSPPPPGAAPPTAASLANPRTRARAPECGAPRPVVQRSTLTPRPAPNRRLAEATPAARPPPAKRVVPRPVNRPRPLRSPPAQRNARRVTPRKKPKVVPRPVGRPRGRARGRRA